MIGFRSIETVDEQFLWDMLYEMVYIPDNEGKPPKEQILNQPRLTRGHSWLMQLDLQESRINRL